MSVVFTSIRNFNERAVCEAVLATAPGYPGLTHDPERLPDVACVALNCPSRYIRHEVDYAFYQTEEERGDSERQVAEAVDFAIGFVQARTAMKARG